MACGFYAVGVVMWYFGLLVASYLVALFCLGLRGFDCYYYLFGSGRFVLQVGC